MYASLARMLSHYRSYNGRYDRSDIHPLTPYPIEEKKPIRSVTDTRLADESLLSYASLWFMFEAMSGLNRPDRRGRLATILIDETGGLEDRNKLWWA